VAFVRIIIPYENNVASLVQEEYMFTISSSTQFVEDALLYTSI